MDKLLSITRSTSRVLVWAGGVLIILSAILVTVEVLMRKFFNVSFGGADELSGYAFGVATSLGMAYALFERAHIRVDALYSLFPGWLKMTANLIGLALLGGFIGVICVTAWGLVSDSLTHGSRSITPMRTLLSIPQIPWLAGWLFFLFCTVLLLLASVVAILKGKPDQASRLIGAKSIDEQIDDEAP